MEQKSEIHTSSENLTFLFALELPKVWNRC